MSASKALDIVLLDDACQCAQCGPERDIAYLWAFFCWIQKIDPDVIAEFDDTYGENELTMN